MIGIADCVSIIEARMRSVAQEVAAEFLCSVLPLPPDAADPRWLGGTYNVFREDFVDDEMTMDGFRYYLTRELRNWSSSSSKNMALRFVYPSQRGDTSGVFLVHCHVYIQVQ